MSDRGLRLAVGAVALAGVAVSAYLTWVHYQPEALVCTTTGGCETVQQSEYATMAGIPVALLGVIAYAAVLVSTVIDTPAARAVTAAIAIAGVGFAAYLILLQAFVIDAWCVWCVVNDAVIVPALAVLAVVRLRGPSGRPTSSEPGGGPSA